MLDFVLFCKTYEGDINRFIRLWKSVLNHNIENIPFYVSLPQNNLELFKASVPCSGQIHWVTDEEIVRISPGDNDKRYLEWDGRLSQQVIKAEFWRLDFCQTYLCLDSDCKFIRNFKKNDFLSDDGVPYTVIHQHKEFIQLSLNANYQNVVSNTFKDMKVVKDYFNRTGPNYDFGPSPLIWDRSVWNDLYEKELSVKNMTLWDAIEEIPNEIKWYGEALLKFKSIELRPISPLMRVYHYYWDYKLLKSIGEREEKLALNYLGVIRQSNWEFETSSLPNKKSFLSVSIRWIKRILT